MGCLLYMLGLEVYTRSVRLLYHNTISDSSMNLV